MVQKQVSAKRLATTGYSGIFFKIFSIGSFILNTRSSLITETLWVSHKKSTVWSPISLRAWTLRLPEDFWMANSSDKYRSDRTTEHAPAITVAWPLAWVSRMRFAFGTSVRALKVLVCFSIASTHQDRAWWRIHISWGAWTRQGRELEVPSEGTKSLSVCDYFRAFGTSCIWAIIVAPRWFVLSTFFENLESSANQCVFLCKISQLRLCSQWDRALRITVRDVRWDVKHVKHAESAACFCDHGRLRRFLDPACTRGFPALPQEPWHSTRGMIPKAQCLFSSKEN